MSIAFECTCHIRPPCWNCENACASCDGTGKVEIRRNRKGEIDYLDGQPTGEFADCVACGGYGTR